MIYYKVIYSKQCPDKKWQMHNDRIILAKDLANILSGKTKSVYFVHQAVQNK